MIEEYHDSNTENGSTPELQNISTNVSNNLTSSTPPKFDLSTPSSSTDELVSQLPSHYQILHLLGEGAFSKVYKAVNTKTNQNVAIKIINKLNLSSKQLNNVKMEINIMSRINHLNVLKLIESYNYTNCCYLILEFCNGGEIFDKIIEYTYFSEPLARHIFKQLLDAINYLHDHNIVHRDIKPENLLFQKIPYFPRLALEAKQALRKSDDASKIDEGEFRPGIGGGSIGVIKLADFGLAKLLHEDPAFKYSSLKTPCGTAGYTAPEVITCNAKVRNGRNFRNNISKNNYYSKSVDIWSLGCFLYTILCGFPPFYDDDSEKLTYKILKGDFVFLEPWWDEIGSDVKDLITKMLDTDPESRITIEEIYNHPWVKNDDSSKIDNQNNYFNLSSTLKSPMNSSEHIEFIGGTTIEDTWSTPTPPSSGLLSPRAEAIKKVFNNPAMANTASVQFIENISEMSSESDNETVHQHKANLKLPRTPTPKGLPGVNFKDVFNVPQVLEDPNDDEFDEEDEDDDDEVTSLKNELQSTSSTSSSSVNSVDEDYQTRSSSVISGMNGDFKFTLNMNDSSLLGRRKSSASKSGKVRKSSVASEPRSRSTSSPPLPASSQQHHHHHHHNHHQTIQSVHEVDRTIDSNSPVLQTQVN